MGYTEISSSHPVGKKDYACEWCDEKIPKGEKHFQRFYIWEGDKNNGRMHLECEAAMDKTPNENKMDGWIPGEPKRGETI
jgi:hypothetical protein